MKKSNLIPSLICFILIIALGANAVKAVNLKLYPPAIPIMWKNTAPSTELN